jgi:hypothetical protein
MNCLKSFDRNGIPINLLHRNNSTYKTGIGALMTILSNIGLLIYMILLLINVAQRDQYTVTSTEF